MRCMPQLFHDTVFQRGESGASRIYRIDPGDIEYTDPAGSRENLERTVQTDLAHLSTRVNIFGRGFVRDRHGNIIETQSPWDTESQNRWVGAQTMDDLHAIARRGAPEGTIRDAHFRIQDGDTIGALAYAADRAETRRAGAPSARSGRRAYVDAKAFNITDRSPIILKKTDGTEEVFSLGTFPTSLARRYVRRGAVMGFDVDRGVNTGYGKKEHTAIVLWEAGHTGIRTPDRPDTDTGSRRPRVTTGGAVTGGLAGTPPRIPVVPSPPTVVAPPRPPARPPVSPIPVIPVMPAPTPGGSGSGGVTGPPATPPAVVPRVTIPIIPVPGGTHPPVNPAPVIPVIPAPVPPGGSGSGGIAVPPVHPPAVVPRVTIPVIPAPTPGGTARPPVRIPTLSENSQDIEPLETEPDGSFLRTKKRMLDAALAVHPGESLPDLARTDPEVRRALVEYLFAGDRRAWFTLDDRFQPDIAEKFITESVEWLRSIGANDAEIATYLPQMGTFFIMADTLFSDSAVNAVIDRVVSGATRQDVFHNNPPSITPGQYEQMITGLFVDGDPNKGVLPELLVTVSPQTKNIFRLLHQHDALGMIQYHSVLSHPKSTDPLHDQNMTPQQIRGRMAAFDAVINAVAREAGISAPAYRASQVRTTGGGGMSRADGFVPGSSLATALGSTYTSVHWNGRFDDTVPGGKTLQDLENLLATQMFDPDFLPPLMHFQSFGRTFSAENGGMLNRVVERIFPPRTASALPALAPRPGMSEVFPPDRAPDYMRPLIGQRYALGSMDCMTTLRDAGQTHPHILGDFVDYLLNDTHPSTGARFSTYFTRLGVGPDLWSNIESTLRTGQQYIVAFDAPSQRGSHGGVLEVTASGERLYTHASTNAFEYNGQVYLLDQEEAWTSRISDWTQIQADLDAGSIPYDDPNSANDAKDRRAAINEAVRAERNANKEYDSTSKHFYLERRDPSRPIRLSFGGRVLEIDADRVDLGMVVTQDFDSYIAGNAEFATQMYIEELPLPGGAWMRRLLSNATTFTDGSDTYAIAYGADRITLTSGGRSTVVMANQLRGKTNAEAQNILRQAVRAGGGADYRAVLASVEGLSGDRTQMRALAQDLETALGNLDGWTLDPEALRIFLGMGMQESSLQWNPPVSNTKRNTLLDDLKSSAVSLMWYPTMALIGNPLNTRITQLEAEVRARLENSSRPISEYEMFEWKMEGLEIWDALQDQYPGTISAIEGVLGQLGYDVSDALNSGETIGLFQININLLAQRIARSPHKARIQAQFPELFESSGELNRAAVGQCLSGLSGAPLNHAQTLQFIFETFLRPRYENHWRGNPAEDTRFMIVENLFGEMSTYCAAIQQQLNTALGLSLALDGDLSNYQDASIEIDWGRQSNTQAALLQYAQNNMGKNPAEARTLMREICEADSWATLQGSELYTHLMGGNVGQRILPEGRSMLHNQTAQQYLSMVSGKAPSVATV